MKRLNHRKFADCVIKYKRECLDPRWRFQQIHKFYFSTYVTSRINLHLSPAPALFEICRRIEDKNFYFSDRTTKIDGLQFLRGTGGERFTEALTIEDAEIIKLLDSKTDIRESYFSSKNMSFNGLSVWLGTLLPHKFATVTSTQFIHVLSYLFDSDLPIYETDPFKYFIDSQQCFQEVKKQLKQVELRGLYLAEINSFIRMQHSKSVGKRSYSEADWNWLTQDFCLFVYREMLHMDTIRMFSANINPTLAQSEFKIAEGMDIYVS